MKWTPVRVRCLRELADQGLPSTEIAEDFTKRGWPTTQSSIAHAARRFGIPLQGAERSSWSEDAIVLLRASVRAGISVASIAKMLNAGCRPGTNVNAVRGKAHKLGISVQNCRISVDVPEPPVIETEPPVVELEPKPIATLAPVPQIRRQKESFPNQCRADRCTNTRAIPYEECVPCREQIRLAKKEVA